ncbi:TPA_asm: N [Nymphaea alba virus 1]|uniref:Nucleoprotein n=1 Tax=Nymphaea alba virus 1 TaxID=2793733 RepID=A0A8D9PH91_9RHAB|nr:N [Nymphaea alba virus 1] [Nymphaea alba virus 1]DAF42339.1 TPA_asm: N [Nymphaea alba virus 1]
MALSALIKRETKYADVGAITVSIAHKVMVWDDKHLESIRIYDIAPLPAVEAVRYGKYMMNCLETGMGLDSRLLSIILMLAVSLRDPDELRQYLMKIPSVKGNRNARPLEIPPVEEVDEDLDDESKALMEAIKKKSNKGKDKSALSDLSKEGETSEPVAEMEGDLTEHASAYSFLAAYLLRLSSRTVDNVFTNLAKAAVRYKGWYERGQIVLEELKVEKTRLEALREVMARRPDVANTWVYWLAKSENDPSLGRQQKGLLDYLGIQIFAYQGMHAVTQIIALQQTCKVPMDVVLRELDSPITRAGVMEVYNIIKNYEKTDIHPNRTTYFRYARVWDTGYFLNVQSKNCAPLVYLAAKTLKAVSSNSLSDPTQIFAVQNIGSAMKERLDRVSDKFSHMLLASATTDDSSGTIWDEEGEVAAQH